MTKATAWNPRVASFIPTVPLTLMLAFALMAAAQTSTAATILKFGYILSPASQLGAGEKTFATEVAARTAGRYMVEEYPNAMLGGEVVMMKGLRVGAIDLAFITGAPLATVVPEAGVFNIPFLFRSAAQARAVFDGPIGEEYLAKFDGSGMVALAWGENGMRHITNSKRPVRDPDDLRGLKLRIPQSDVMAAGFEALGVKVQQMPFTQVYNALQSGQVDGEENPIATILSSQFVQVQRYLTLSAHVYDPAVILMSSDAYDELSDADRRAFKEAARLAGQASRESASEAESRGTEMLKSQGMAVVDGVDTASFSQRVSTAAPYFDKLFGHDVIARIRDYRAPDGPLPDKPPVPAKAPPR